MKYRVFLILATALLGACGKKEPEVKIEAFDRINSVFNVRFVQVRLTSLANDIEIKDIIVNRGNCKIENDLRSSSATLPKRLKFGEVIAMNFSGPCQASQVDVITSRGSWSVTYK